MDTEKPPTNSKPEPTGFIRASHLVRSFGKIWDAAFAIFAVVLLVTYFVTFELQYLVLAIVVAFAAFLSWQVHKNVNN